MKRIAVAATLVLWLAPSGSAAPIAAVSACASETLSAVANLHGTSWMLVGSITVRNEGAAPCSLPARPAVGVEWRGKRLGLRRVAFPSGLALTTWRPVRTLRPKSTAVVFVAWTSWCGPYPWPSPFRPTLTVASGAGDVAVEVSAPVLTPRCNVAGGPGSLGSTGFLAP